MSNKGKTGSCFLTAWDTCICKGEGSTCRDVNNKSFIEDKVCRKENTTTETGHNLDSTPLSREDCDLLVRDGLLSLQSLIKHVLEGKSIITQDVLLSIISVRVASLNSQLKKFK